MTSPRKAGRKPRLTISLSAALARRIHKERWRRKAASISALIESLLWEALAAEQPPHKPQAGG